MRKLLAVSCLAVILSCIGLLDAGAQSPNTQKGDSHKATAGKSTLNTTKKGDTVTLTPVTKGNTVTQPKQGKMPGDPHQAGKKKADALIKSSNSGSWNLSADQQAAMGKLLSQQPLSFDDRQQLSNLLFNGTGSGLSAADEANLSYLLADDLTRNDNTAAAVPAATSTSGPMFLRVLNKTTEPIKVWVQVVSPGASTGTEKSALPETLSYDLKPGKAYDLQNSKGQRLQASAIRIWALSPTQHWASNRDRDLPLTSASASKVFLVTFAPPSSTTTTASAQAIVAPGR
jgi:hypothetical protein